MVTAFAMRHSFRWQTEKKIKGRVALGLMGEGRVILLFPLTYMNLSGDSVQRALAFYHVPVQELLVLSDDSALPFGVLRYRERGSDGGHNGLRNVAERLRTTEYQRLRLGIGAPGSGNLEEYVLSPFSRTEEEQLPEIMNRAVAWMEHWLLQERRNTHG